MAPTDLPSRRGDIAWPFPLFRRRDGNQQYCWQLNFGLLFTWPADQPRHATIHFQYPVEPGSPPNCQIGSEQAIGIMPVPGIRSSAQANSQSEMPELHPFRPVMASWFPITPKIRSVALGLVPQPAFPMHKVHPRSKSGDMGHNGHQPACKRSASPYFEPAPRSNTKSLNHQRFSRSATGNELTVLAFRFHTKTTPRESRERLSHMGNPNINRSEKSG